MRASGGLDVGRLLALGSLGHFEADLLTFLQCLEPRHVDRGKMREQVFTAAVRRDEAEALRIVEPLNGSGCHSATSLQSERDVGFVWTARTTCGAGAQKGTVVPVQTKPGSQTPFFYAFPAAGVKPEVSVFTPP